MQMDRRETQQEQCLCNDLLQMSESHCVTGRESFIQNLITLLKGLISHLFAGGSCKPVIFNKQMDATEVGLMLHDIFNTALSPSQC